MNFSEFGFVLVGVDGVKSTHFVSTKDEYNTLLKYASDYKLFLYQGTLQKVNGVNVILHPWIIVEKSISKGLVGQSKALNIINIPSPVVAEDLTEGEEHICKFCGKPFNSKSGLTNHIKSKHGDYDEPNEPQDQESTDIIKCQYCGKKLNSVYGLTNHIKAKHPEKLDEYQQHRK